MVPLFLASEAIKSLGLFSKIMILLEMKNVTSLLLICPEVQ